MNTLLLLVLVACAPAQLPESTPTVPQRTESPTATNAAKEATATPTVVPFTREEPLPSLAGALINKRLVPEPTPVPFKPILPLDGIRPIYNPEFTLPANVTDQMSPDELVIGVAWEGEAKAYPVTVLRNREIVNDELAGIPILVTF